MELKVLASSYVSLAKRGEPGRAFAECVELIGSKPAKRSFYPKHLRIRLTLTVNALPQTERRKIVRRPLARAEPLCLFLEVLDLFGENFYDTLYPGFPFGLRHSLVLPPDIRWLVIALKQNAPLVASTERGASEFRKALCDPNGRSYTRMNLRK
jgi:hypothetical protein